MATVKKQQNIPDEWNVHTIGSFSEISRGGSPRPIQDYLTDSEDGYNWLRIGDVPTNGKYISKITAKIIKEGLKKTTQVKEGDFILSNSMSFGRPYIMKVDACIHDGWLALKKLDTNLIERDFLFYLLLSPKLQNDFRNYSAGSGVLNLKKDTVEKVAVTIPSVAEQKRIVKVLETWDEAIEKLGQMIALKREVKKGLMQKLLTGELRLPGFKGEWKKVSLGDIGQVITGSTPAKKDDDNYGEEFCWATADDMDGKYVADTLIKLSEKGKNASRVLPAGAVLVTCIASIGKNAIAKVPLATNQQINSIVTNKSFSNEFVYYLLTFKKHVLEARAGAGAMRMLSKGEFMKIEFDFPEKEEQDAIARVLATADTEIDLLTKKQKKLQDQKKYLLNNLVTGQIRTPKNL